MKEKKLVASVILGVALVSLITALVAAFAESITLFIDIKNVQNANLHDDYEYVVGWVTMGSVLFGIAFVAVFFANRKHRFAVNLTVNLGLAIAMVAYCVASLIVVRFLVPTSEGYRNVSGKLVGIKLYATDYALFTSYLTTAITFMVSAALVFAAWLYLTLVKKKEESAPAENPSEQSK